MEKARGEEVVGWLAPTVTRSYRWDPGAHGQAQTTTVASLGTQEHI